MTTRPAAATSSRRSRAKVVRLRRDPRADAAAARRSAGARRRAPGRSGPGWPGRRPRSRSHTAARSGQRARSGSQASADADRSSAAASRRHDRPQRSLERRRSGRFDRVKASSRAKRCRCCRRRRRSWPIAPPVRPTTRTCGACRWACRARRRTRSGSCRTTRTRRRRTCSSSTRGTSTATGRSSWTGGSIRPSSTRRGSATRSGGSTTRTPSSSTRSASTTSSGSIGRARRTPSSCTRSSAGRGSTRARSRNEVTIEDPGAFSRPFTTTWTARLQAPGDEIMEYICQENNQYGIAGGHQNPFNK